MLSSLQNSQSRSVIQALVVFLFKLSTGNSSKMIASIFELKNEHNVSDYFKRIIKSYKSDVILFCFGFNYLNREDLIQNHTAVTEKKLFNADEKLF